MKIKALLKSLFIGNHTFIEAPALLSPTEFQAEIAKLQQDLRITQCAHRAHSRRIAVFGQEQPELFNLYFTKAGDKARKENRHAAA